ncbi:MAG: transcription initiation factor IIB [Candidatus Bathyarchaeota archaeon]|nr:MAG: transcription initiation factor IIB [Candidatus Bathyarchaeota archaeon]
MIMDKRLRHCPECGNEDLIRDYEAGELVCESCGFVLSSKIFNQGPEWRAFDEEQREKRSRVGAPLTWTIHDKGLSTIIDWHDRDVYGRKLAPDQKARVYRLRKWHRRSKVSGATERNLAFALSELTKIAYKLNLPKNVLETASIIYRRVVQRRLIRGRSIQGVAAAATYMACRQCNVIRTLEEVAEAAHISKKEGGRNYRFLLRRLETRVPQVDPQGYVSKFVSQLTLSGETENIALRILDRATDLRLTSGRGPAGIAAAATYIATLLTDERRTQGEIARGAHVTEVTIRNRYKELTQKLSIEVDI